jgi:hypothetical protein
MKSLIAIIAIVFLLTACGDDGDIVPAGIMHFQLNTLIDNSSEDEDQFFDINGDGYSDFGIKYDCEGSEHTIELLADCDDEFHFPDGRVSMFLDIRFDSESGMALVNRVPENAVISEKLGLDGGCGHLAFRDAGFGGMELGDFGPGSGEGYIAMQIRNPDGLYHFGWLKAVVSSGCEGILISEGAYEIRQGKAILAGQVE